VHSHLSDFLFPAERARSPVKSLSGGERNRLLLARLFTRPANVLILDEPTNDLDLETLELLEEQLAEFAGTVLLVSHDRVFLDNVVTSTLVFEGEGRVSEYVGGYEDWLRQRDAPKTVAPVRHPAPAPPPKPVKAPAEPAKPKKKLSFKEQREYGDLPARIEQLEREQRELEARVASPSFYKEGSVNIAKALARLDALPQELVAALARWDELDARTK
jgi:ATP-binding cassette subfamily F protein uup